MIRPQNIIPVNIRQYVSKALGNRDPLTEEHMNPADLNALRRNVINDQLDQRVKNYIGPPAPKDQGVVTYGQYGKIGETGDFSNWSGGGGYRPGVNLMSALLGSLFDSRFRMETTVGEGGWKKDENGNVIVEDQYNFNAEGDALKNAIAKYGSPTKAIVAGAKDAGLEGFLNAFGNFVIGDENTKGAPVKINLGNPKDWNVR